MERCCGSFGGGWRGASGQVGQAETKVEEAGRAEGQSVSALHSESEATASLKGLG